MTPSLKGWPAKAKKAPSPHELRLALLDTNPVFQSLRGDSKSRGSISKSWGTISKSRGIKLHLKNQKFVFALKIFFEEPKRFLSYQICCLMRNLELTKV